MDIIRTENLTKIYRKRHLGKLKETLGVRNLNLEIREGEIFSLLGLNGSGKTTTIKLLLGLLFPTQGRVYIREKLMPNKEIVRLVGYLPELPYFYKYLTIDELLNLYGCLSEITSQEISQRIRQVLKIVALEKERNKRIAELSRGMLQRVGIAQALLHSPEIVIFDEPVSGLDPVGIREMRELLLKLKKEGKTIFFSSHIISEVEKISDRAGILDQGELVCIVEQKDWFAREGGLEEIFLETIKSAPTVFALEPAQA
jgi:ABC-2 type transport system ATP-binding protein